MEEFLTGIVLSVFVLTDGKDYILLPEAKDYKRIGEGDTGPNTGGMGAVSPVPFADKDFMEKVVSSIVAPTVAGLQKDGLDYKGFIFAGLMKVGDEPYVIEYNCRMGDPETEVVMPRIKNDLVEILSATARQELAGISIQCDEQYATTIVAVSGGYPNEYEKDIEIKNLDTRMAGTLLFHSGTRRAGGKILTSGGRVLCATGLAETLEEAINRSRDLVESIDFEGKYFRRDIGFEFLTASADVDE